MSRHTTILPGSDQPPVTHLDVLDTTVSLLCPRVALPIVATISCMPASVATCIRRSSCCCVKNSLCGARWLQ